MNASHQLASRFREVVLDGKWVANTNYKEQLESLSFVKANTSVESLNSIVLLAQHIHYYIDGVKKVLEGGSLDIRDAYSFDFPKMTSEKEWSNFLEKFWQDAETFAVLVEELDTTQLQQPFVNEKYGSYLRNIDGMIEHCYYHLGQIVLLKKILSEKDR